jgi:TRAP-type uncharacterized transport system fused permease subunit
VTDRERFEGQREQRKPWWKAVLSDVHFWVPVVVLVAGLIVLRWIS